jgi:hypothetical protein
LDLVHLELDPVHHELGSSSLRARPQFTKSLDLVHLELDPVHQELGSSILRARPSSPRAWI